MLSAEYFLEDCIQMTNFVPPPMDRKKKDKDEEGGDEDVRRRPAALSVARHEVPHLDSRFLSADELQHDLWAGVRGGDEAFHGSDKREGDVVRAGRGSAEVHRDATGVRRRPRLPARLEPHLLHAEAPGDEPTLW